VTKPTNKHPFVLPPPVYPRYAEGDGFLLRYGGPGPGCGIDIWNPKTKTWVEYEGHSWGSSTPMTPDEARVAYLGSVPEMP
jgi:hypothetical protein